MAKQDKKIQMALGILTAIGGAEHVAQAMGNSLLNLPIVASAPMVVQVLVGLACVAVAYQLISKK